MAMPPHTTPTALLDSPPLAKSRPSLSASIHAPHAAPASPRGADHPLNTNQIPCFDFGFDFPSDTLELTLPLPQVEITNDDAVASQKPQPPPESMSSRPQSKNRSKSLVGRPKSWLPSRSHATDHAEVPRKDKKAEDAKVAASGSPRPGHTTRSRSRSFKGSSFADYAMKSWGGARSPSPKRDIERERLEALKGLEGVPKSDSAKEPSVLSPRKLTRRKDTADSTFDKEKAPPIEATSMGKGGTSRALKYLGKMKQTRQASLAVAKAHDTLAVPHGPSAKLDKVSPAVTTHSQSDHPDRRLSSQTNLSSHSDSNTGGTDSTGLTDSSHVPEAPTSQKSQPQRDPLSATFRRLDSEYAIFLTKTSTSQRVLIARNALIPFFRNHGGYPSADFGVLSHENIDRRTTVLHKWWNGLLELIEGTGPKREAGGPATTFASIQAKDAAHGLYPASGVDRPGLLELVTNIMMRPEWRICTPAFKPLKHRTAHEVSRGRPETRNSVYYIAESAEHNVRTMFINNLLTQMGTVVDKMSSRHAPASLVTFCGKACAYAFFFVPGIAEVLVRLWGLTPDLLRRVADEFGLPRRSRGDSADVTSFLPPNLQKLAWTSVKTMTDNLRLTTKLSLTAARIQWHGPWVSRWRGADSDLFFIFSKYYYILMEDFVPVGLPLKDKARAPGFALIHAQLLSVLDSTIHHRQAAFENMMGPHIVDTTNGVDAMAAALATLPPNNLLRGMDENRLIILLKDMLAENSVGGLTVTARELFAASFMSLLKAATQKTPAFRQAPTLVLIDFFSEVLLVLDAYSGYTDPRHEDQQSTDHVDWQFWFDVLHKVLFESNSTMSEIRVLSLLFSAWDVLTADPARKEKLCIGWLLTERVFDKLFNNYTPMVRAYFMRLLCWRVCREQGRPSELDMRIFHRVSDRLTQAWSHHLWMRQAADVSNKVPPSTAPCHPQPGKRFMIIRTEQPAAQTGLLQTGFDTINSTFGAHEASSAAPAFAEKSSADPPMPHSEPAAKKRWSILGKLMSFSSANGLASSTATDVSRRNSTAKDDLAEARRATAAERSGSQHLPRVSHRSNESDASSTGSLPIYETAQFVFRFTLGSLPWNPMADMTNAALAMLTTLPRERPLSRPRLPAPAQARVSARPASVSSGNDTPSLPSRNSGTSETGSINGARNAAVPEAIETESDQETPTGKESQSFHSVFLLPEIKRIASNQDRAGTSLTASLSNGSTIRVEAPRPRRGRDKDHQVVNPVEPVGVFKDRATYSGRALAEWNIVVHECNSFFDRRRDEGILELRDVEVPSLGVENLRRTG